MTEQDYKVVQFLRSLRIFGLELEFDNIKDFFGQVTQSSESDPLPVRILSWKTMQFAVEKALNDFLLGGEGLPAQAKAPLSELYKRLCDYLKAIHSIKFCAGGHALILEFKNMNVFEALPTLDAVEAKRNSNN